jgi:hypothetical protein
MRTLLLAALLALAGCASQGAAPIATAPAAAPAEAPPAAPIVAADPIVVESFDFPDPDQVEAPPEEGFPTNPVEGHIRIKAVGDIMLGTDYPEDRLPPDDGQAQLAAVKELLKDADVTFGNLEGALADGLPPTKVCKDASSCYLFRTPTRFAETLKDAGFDVMSLANNHARDFGEEGRDSSKKALREAWIGQSGREPRDGYPDGDVLRWATAGRSIALIAFAPNPGNHSLLDIPTAVERVKKLAAEKDLVIVSFHGGGEGADRTHVVKGMEEFRGEQRGDLIAFSHAVIDAGADLVIGHGPHVPRALELYQGRLIAYSLGNFATWYGISINGVAGYAPVLEATLDEAGALVEGRIHSNVQDRVDGVVPDPAHKAYRLMRELTEQDFPEHGIDFADDGGFRPKR